MRKRYVLLVLTFLLVLMCVQGVIATSAQTANARLMFIALVGFFAVALAILLALLGALLVRTAYAERRETAWTRAVVASKESLHLRQEAVSFVIRNSARTHVTSRRPYRRLCRLLALREDYAAQSLVGLALRERIIVCERALEDVTDSWISDDLALHLLALGPLDEFLLEVWGLEEEIVAHDPSVLQEEQTIVEYDIPSALRAQQGIAA